MIKIALTIYEPFHVLHSCHFAIVSKLLLYLAVPTVVSFPYKIKFFPVFRAIAATAPSLVCHSLLFRVQKQPSRDVLTNRCSENMDQIYRRTPLQKCDFNKVTKQQSTFSQS